MFSHPTGICHRMLDAAWMHIGVMQTAVDAIVRE